VLLSVVVAPANNAPSALPWTLAGRDVSGWTPSVFPATMLAVSKAAHSTNSHFGRGSDRRSPMLTVTLIPREHSIYRRKPLRTRPSTP